MATPQAAEMEIVTIPRLPVARLFELRRFLDQNVVGLSSAEQVSAGGRKHGDVEGSPDKSVRASAPSGRAAGAATSEGVTVAGVVVDRSASGEKRTRGRRAIKGGRP